MSIQALGYLGIGTDKLDDWSDYATNWLGMEAVDRGAGVRAFRMDDRRQRLVLDAPCPTTPTISVGRWPTLPHLMLSPAGWSGRTSWCVARRRRWRTSVSYRV